MENINFDKLKGKNLSKKNIVILNNFSCEMEIDHENTNVFFKFKKRV